MRPPGSERVCTMCTYVSTINTTPAFTELAGRKEVSHGGHDVEPEGLLGQQPTRVQGQKHL